MSNSASTSAANTSTWSHFLLFVIILQSVEVFTPALPRALEHILRPSLVTFGNKSLDATLLESSYHEPEISDDESEPSTSHSAPNQYVEHVQFISDEESVEPNTTDPTSISHSLQSTLENEDILNTISAVRIFMEHQRYLEREITQNLQSIQNIQDQLYEAADFVKEMVVSVPPDRQNTFFSRSPVTWTHCVFEARRRSTLMARHSRDYFGSTKVVKSLTEFKARKEFETIIPLVFVPREWLPKEEEILLDMIHGENMRIKIEEACSESEAKLRSANAMDADALIIQNLNEEMCRIQNLPDKDLEDNDPGIRWEYIVEHALPKYSAKECLDKFLHLRHPDQLGKTQWDSKEDDYIHNLVLRYGKHDWPLICEKLNKFNKDRGLKHGRRPADCLGRYTKLAKAPRAWTAEEDTILKRAADLLGAGNWVLISGFLEERTPQQCMFRWRILNSAKIHRRGRWAADEDKILVLAWKAFPPDFNTVTSYGYIRKRPKMFWRDIAKIVKTRSESACRERYTSTFDSSIKSGRWSHEEDQRLSDAVGKCGFGKWSQIAREMGGRSDSQCSRRWRALTSRSLTESTFSSDRGNERDDDDEEDYVPPRQSRRRLVRKCKKRKRVVVEVESSSEESSVEAETGFDPEPQVTDEAVDRKISAGASERHDDGASSDATMEYSPRAPASPELDEIQVKNAKEQPKSDKISNQCPNAITQRSKTGSDRESSDLDESVASSSQKRRKLSESDYKAVKPQLSSVEKYRLWSNKIKDAIRKKGRRRAAQVALSAIFAKKLPRNFVQK